MPCYSMYRMTKDGEGVKRVLPFWLQNPDQPKMVERSGASRPRLCSFGTRLKCYRPAQAFRAANGVIASQKTLTSMQPK